VGSRPGLNEVAKRKILSPFRESNPGHPVRTLVAIPTEIPEFLIRGLHGGEIEVLVFWVRDAVQGHQIRFFPYLFSFKVTLFL
jgi:hypothetical protein